MGDDRVVVIGSGPCGAMAAATLVERGVDVLMLDAGLRAPTGFVVRAAGNTIARRYGWSEYSTDRLDPSSARDVDWVLQPVARWAVQLLDGRRPAVRPGGLHRRCPTRRALRVADLVRRPRAVLRPGRACAHRHGRRRDQRRAVRRGSATSTACRRTGRSSPTPRPSDGHGVGALPMAKGSPWMAARRSTEFCSYHCVVAPLLESPRFTLTTGAHALRLDTTGDRVDSGDLPRSADRASSNRPRCRAVVVAAGAIDSTVLLLRSTSSRFPDRPRQRRSASSAATSTITPGSGGRRRPSDRSARSPTRSTSRDHRTPTRRRSTGSSITLGLATTQGAAAHLLPRPVTHVRCAGVRHDGADALTSASSCRPVRPPMTRAFAR